MHFTHIINPFVAPAGSPHALAQPITFAALRRAIADAAAQDIRVEVLAPVFPDDEPAVEAPAKALPLLTRTVSDVVPLSAPAPFPLCQDVLQIGADHGSGEYVVFTNMDICPQPYLYRALAAMIAGQPDRAFVIPRRTIAARFTDPSQLSEMLAEPGVPHEGFDCFVFPRKWVSKFDLGNLCLGIPSWDLALILNLDVVTGFKLKVLWNQFLTFHLGDDKDWKTRRELLDHNDAEFTACAHRLREHVGRIPARSKFEYAQVWVTGCSKPPAPAWMRILRRLEQSAAEWRNRWMVRQFRRELGVPSW